MPRYLISVLDDTSNSATGDESATIDAFNDQLQADGHWIMAAGIAAPATATVIDARHGEPVITEGPYAVTDVWTAGFWIISAPDRDTALRLAAQGSKACNRRVEVRAFLGG